MNEDEDCHLWKTTIIRAPQLILNVRILLRGRLSAKMPQCEPPA